MEQPIINMFKGGMEQDLPFSDDTNPYQVSYLEAMNFINLGDNHDGFLSTELGSTVIPNEDYVVKIELGNCVVGHKLFKAVILADDSSRILMYEEGTWAVVSDTNLNFSPLHGVKMVGRTIYDATIALYFTDNFNPVKYINYTGSTTEAIPLFDSIKQPKLVETINVGGGSIACGGYLFGVAFLSSDGQVLKYSDTTKLMPIAKVVKYGQISQGGYNIDKASASVKIRAYDLDSNYQYLQLYMVRGEGLDNVLNAYLIGNPVLVTDTEYTFSYTGYEDLRQVSILEVSVALAVYRKAKNVVIANNTLTFSHLTELEFDYPNSLYEEVGANLRIYSVIETHNKSEIEAYPELQAGIRGYKTNEVYAFAYSLVTTDGAEIGTFHIPAPYVSTPDTTNINKNPTGGGAQLGTYTSNNEYSPTSYHYAQGSKIRHHVFPRNMGIYDGVGLVRTCQVKLGNITAALNRLRALESVIDPTTPLSNKIVGVRLHRGLRDKDSNKTIVSQGVAYPLTRGVDVLWAGANGQVGLANEVYGSESLSGLQPVYNNEIVEQYWQVGTLVNDGGDLRNSYEMSWNIGTRNSNKVVNYYSPETTFGRLNVGNLQIRPIEALRCLQMEAWADEAGINNRKNFTAENLGEIPNSFFSPTDNRTWGSTSLIADYQTTAALLASEAYPIDNEASFYASRNLRYLVADNQVYAKTSMEQNSQIFSTTVPFNMTSLDYGARFNRSEGEEAKWQFINGTYPAADVYRFDVEAINLSCYGALSDVDYILVGETSSLEDFKVFNGTGDTWVTRFGFRHSVTASGGSGGGWSYAMGMFLGSFWVESQYNCFLRHTTSEKVGGDFSGGLPNYPTSNLKLLLQYNIMENSGTYNSSYSYENSLHINKDLPQFTNRVNYFPNRIVYSDPAVEGATFDTFRIFRINNYKDITRNRGAIFDMFYFDNDLFAHCEYGLFKTYMRQSTGVLATEGTFVLGSASLFSLPEKEVTTIDGGYGGTQDSWSGVTTPIGRFFIDRHNKNVFLLVAGTSSAAANTPNTLKDVTKGLRTEFNKLLKFSTNNTNDEYNNRPYSGRVAGNIGQGFHSVYDTGNSRILLTKVSVTEGESFTLSFSLLNGRWVSYHSYIPTNYATIGDATYMTESQTMKLLGSAPSTPANSYIKYRVVADPKLEMQINNQVYNMQIFDNGVLVRLKASAAEDLITYTTDKGTSGVKTIRYLNNTHHFLLQNQVGFKHYRSAYNINTPRMSVAESLPFAPMLRGKFFDIKLVFTNPATFNYSVKLSSVISNISINR